MLRRNHRPYAKTLPLISLRCNYSLCNIRLACAIILYFTKRSKKTTKKGLIFQFSAQAQPSLILSFFLRCFRDETRLARPFLSLSLSLAPTTA